MNIEFYVPTLAEITGFIGTQSILTSVIILMLGAVNMIALARLRDVEERLRRLEIKAGGK